MAGYTKRDGQIPSRFVCIYTYCPHHTVHPEKYTTFAPSLGCYSDNVTFDSIR